MRSDESKICRGLIRIGVVVALMFAGVAQAQVAGDGGLDRDIAELLDAESVPRVIADPTERYLLLVRSRPLLSIERLAEPAIELAGRRVNPHTASPHAPIEYFSLTLFDMVTGERYPISLPRGAVIGFPQWAPNGARFVFPLTRPGSEMELWVGEPAEAHARPLLTGVNGIRNASCAFTPGSRLLCKRLLDKPRRHPASVIETRSDALVAAAASPLGPQPLEESLVTGLLESRLELVDPASGQRHVIGEPAAFDLVEAAPAGAYLLVKKIEPPYPRYSGVDPVTTVTEIWDRFGNVVARLPESARAVGWHASEPARVVWVEHRDGADRIRALSAPFSDLPDTPFTFPGRFGGMRWVGDRDAALVGDYDGANRLTDLWYVPVGNESAKTPRRLTRYSSTSPRLPLMRINSHGAEVVGEHDGSIFLRGYELSGGRRQVFLERLSLDSGERERVWTGDGGQREELLEVFGDAADYLLVRRESPVSPPNYYLSHVDGAAAMAVTHDVHPVPVFADTQRMRLEYLREDGTELSASLYLPPEGTAAAHEPLPMIVWAYPQRVLAGSSARLPDTTDRFPTFDRAFRHYFLLRGYAILDDVSMPVVGNDVTANDTFIDQIVANAQAAIEAAVSTGHVDTSRVGVAGHSYGAFMVANLLAHSRLFRAGVALSGAYNRTLTPFGFQTERRTLWDAPETYLAMSPVIFADRVEAPLLLVHGTLDDNAGTAPIQSTQFFQAIRGNGGVADLLLLPWEGHEYRARESVFRTAAEMLDWFDHHMQPRADIETKKTGAFLRP